MTTTLREQAEDYLRLRRALGFTLVETEKLLMQFISHLEDLDVGTITIDVAVAWARQPPTASPAWWSRRLMAPRSPGPWPADGARTAAPPSVVGATMQAWR